MRIILHGMINIQGFDQRLGSIRNIVAVLHPGKSQLKLSEHSLLPVISNRSVEDELSELNVHKELLDQRIEIASLGQIFQTCIASFLTNELFRAQKVEL